MGTGQGSGGPADVGVLIVQGVLKRVPTILWMLESGLWVAKVGRAVAGGVPVLRIGKNVFKTSTSSLDKGASAEIPGMDSG